MKKLKLIIATVAVLCLAMSSAASADGFAPGEGLYVGAFAAGSMGIVQPKVTTQGAAIGHAGSQAGEGHNIGGTFQAADGGLGLAGIEGGGTLGYGYKMGDVYAGIEGEMTAGDVKFKLTSDVRVRLSGSVENANAKYITEVEAKKDWTGGMFGRVGYYINADTLFAFRGGVLVTKFDVATTGDVNYQENFYGGGPSFGASLESRLTAIDPNLSLRIGAVYTDFLTASVFGLGTNTATNVGDIQGHDSEVTGSAMSARIGLQYSFFDANSLF